MEEDRMNLEKIRMREYSYERHVVVEESAKKWNEKM